MDGVEYIITAAKFEDRHNGEKCAKYWAIESEFSLTDDCSIYDHWFCSRTPKRILQILENAAVDNSHYALKRGKFILKLKRKLVFRDFHRVDFENVINIELINEDNR